tara:strand:+ start:2051 stop:4744 length:2694 start_codon:yes stop_codon:yes gene_type:complete
MNPLKYAQMMKYLTRAKKVNPELPDVFPASKAPIPAKKESIKTMEAVNRFVRDNPRQDMAGGGMLVQPGFGGTRQGYKQERKSKNYPNLVKEYDEMISNALKDESFKNTKSFQQFLKDKNINPKAFSEWKRKGNAGIKIDLASAKNMLAETLVNKANANNKIIYVTDIAPKLNLTWQGTYSLLNKNELFLESPKTKAIKVFNNFMSREKLPAKEMFNMVTQMANEVGVTPSSFSTIMKDYPDYEDARRLFKNLATPSSKKWILNNPDATFADVIDKVEGRQFRENLLGNIRSGKASAEHKILTYAARHAAKGGNKIEFTKKAGLDKFGNVKDYRDVEFIYKLDPNDSKTWSRWSYDRILTEGAKSEIFQDIYKAEADLNRMLSTVVKDPRTGNNISFGKLMTDTYSKEGGHTFGFAKTPYEIDHIDGVLTDPFKNVRILPRRINQMLGQIKRQADIATTPGTGMKIKNIVKYIGKNKNQILETIDPNFKNIQSVDDLIKNELFLSNKVFDTLKINPQLKGNVLKSSKEIFNEVISMGDRLGPIDINFKTSKLGKLTPPGSGAVTLGALDVPSMFKRLSPATRKLVSGFGGFVLPEVLFYQLDKRNRMSKGQSEKEAAAGALESGTLGAYNNKAYMEELKKVAESMNIDSNSFDSAYQLNLLSKSYEQNNANYEKNYMQLLEMGDEKRADDLKKNFDRYTKETQNKYALLANDISDNVMNTVGASPLIMKQGRENITQEQFEKPFFDMQDAAMEKLKKEKQKAFDTQSRQVDTAAGSIGENFYQTFDSLTQGAKNLLQGRIIPFGPERLRPLESEREQEARLLKEMDPRELFLYNKARGVTYDQPITPADFENLTFEQPGLFAGGGIAKMAGVSSGPPPESGPMSQGLPGLLKRGIKG